MRALQRSVEMGLNFNQCVKLDMSLIKTKDSINCRRQLRHEWSTNTAGKEGNLTMSLYSLQCDMQLILPWMKKSMKISLCRHLTINLDPPSLFSSCLFKSLKLILDLCHFLVNVTVTSLAIQAIWKLLRSREPGKQRSLPL